MYQDKHLFDFGGYENDSSYHSNKNKKVTGKMKDWVENL